VISVLVNYCWPKEPPRTPDTLIGAKVVVLDAPVGSDDADTVWITCLDNGRERWYEVYDELYKAHNEVADIFSDAVRMAHNIAYEVAQRYAQDGYL
jgi:hypothetical protein